MIGAWRCSSIPLASRLDREVGVNFLSNPLRPGTSEADLVGSLPSATMVDMRFLSAVFAASLIFASTLHAQTEPMRPPPIGPDPVVNADRTVTFHVLAPSTARVTVVLEGVKEPLPMVKDDAPGIWSLTTEPLAPEYYSYHFEVNGHEVIDPHNVMVKASYTSVGSGFLVPGATPEPWETTAIPHGEIHHHFFTTSVVEGLAANQDEFYVYTPPGYDPRSPVKYPVLYLLHGWSDTAAGWSAIGHANDVLDNLIAQGKAKPMIVVMPLGYGAMSFVRSGFGVWNDRAQIDENVSLFAKALLTEVMPQVERLYNVSAKRQDRAIAGLSMGGLESLTVGLENTDKFAYVGGFSAAVHMLKPETLTGLNPKTANLKLLWIACGTSDGLIEPNRKLVAALTAEGLPVTPIETPGMHTWLVWRDNLAKFVPLLFQSKL